jgi:hypothetical protein
MLAAHTDAVLAGGEGGSFAHYFYIATDAVLFVVLVWLVTAQARRLIGVREIDVAGSR